MWDCVTTSLLKMYAASEATVFYREENITPQPRDVLVVYYSHSVELAL